MFPSRWEGISGSGQGRAGKVDTVGKLKVRKQQFAGALFLQRKANKALFHMKRPRVKLEWVQKKIEINQWRIYRKRPTMRKKIFHFLRKSRSHSPQWKEKLLMGPTLSALRTTPGEIHSSQISLCLPGWIWAGEDPAPPPPLVRTESKDPPLCDPLGNLGEILG